MVSVSVRAGWSAVNANGGALRMASRTMPPPRAVSVEAIKIPKMSSLFLMATKKPLMVKAVMPMISAKIKYSGILVLVVGFELYIA